MNYYQILNWLLISTIWHVSLLQILSGLYIGNFRDSKDLKQLDLHKITHILSIHDDARKLFKVQIAKVFWPLKGGLITESFFFGSNLLKKCQITALSTILLNRRWDLQGGKFYWIELKIVIWHFWGVVGAKMKNFLRLSHFYWLMVSIIFRFLNS